MEYPKKYPIYTSGYDETSYRNKIKNENNIFSSKS